ncbi:cyclophilin-like fold protein [Kribbella alba]|uniref:cyclophilin-like fold protein n=1 Tax=Kribbella alba TaxID=190197 RepID=UPI003CD0AFF4
MTAGTQVSEATLNNTQVAQDFKKMLPVTLPWFRNSGIEYITELDAPLTESGPFYTDVQPGDLVYYNPARQHHHQLRRDQLSPQPHQNGRDHLRPERVQRPPRQHPNAHPSQLAQPDHHHRQRATTACRTTEPSTAAANSSTQIRQQRRT